MVAALELNKISFVRDGHTILDAVSLTVEADQRWLVLGANGSGKTTLVRIAAMYEHPTYGSVSVLGLLRIGVVVLVPPSFKSSVLGGDHHV